jgi:hypothetical protein
MQILQEKHSPEMAEFLAYARSWRSRCHLSKKVWADAGLIFL